jgi:hypothetical protein
MKSITRLFYLSAVLSAGTSLAQAATVNDPRCERLQDPLGIDMPQPALGWSVESGTRGDVQTAYQVLVAPTPALLAADHGDLWDSGKVASDVSAQVEYAGKPSDWSPPASWTMGLLDEKDWQGSWIGARPGTPSGKRVPMRDGNLPPAQPGPIDPADAPAVLLRHEVDLPKRVVHATVSFCGLGYGELYINGKRVGDRRLDPAFTDYMRRVLYSTYDVTEGGKPAAQAQAVRFLRMDNGAAVYEVWAGHYQFSSTANAMVPQTAVLPTPAGQTGPVGLVGPAAGDFSATLKTPAASWKAVTRPLDEGLGRTRGSRFGHVLRD